MTVDSIKTTKTAHDKSEARPLTIFVCDNRASIILDLQTSGNMLVGNRVASRAPAMPFAHS